MASRVELHGLVDQVLAVLRVERIEHHQRRNRLIDFFRDAGNHHAAIGMADQHDVLQFLPFDEVRDVGNVRVEIDRSGAERCERSATPVKRRREDVMALRGKKPRHALPAPAAMPGAVNENKSRHRISPCRHQVARVISARYVVSS